MNNITHIINSFKRHKRQDIDSTAIDFTNSIPRDVTLVILRFIHPIDRLSVSRVNKRLCEWIREDETMILFISNIKPFINNPNKILYYAAKNGDGRLIDFAIRRGARNWERGLWMAAEGGHMKYVQFFLEKGAKYTERAVCHAANSGHKDIIDFLLEQKMARVNPHTAMYAAIRGNHKELMPFFREKGADDWHTVLRGAAFTGDTELLNEVIDYVHNRVANDKWNRYWESALEGAAEGGHREWVDFFISKGASNWNDGLNSASKGGHIDLIHFFIEKGADDLGSALAYAVKGEKRKAIDLLIEKGANDWANATHAALVVEDHVLVDFFIQKGAKYVDVGLIESVQLSNMSLVDYFISKGATPELAARILAPAPFRNELLAHLKIADPIKKSRYPSCIIV